MKLKKRIFKGLKKFDVDSDKLGQKITQKGKLFLKKGKKAVKPAKEYLSPALSQLKGKKVFKGYDDRPKKPKKYPF